MWIRTGHQEFYNARDTIIFMPEGSTSLHDGIDKATSLTTTRLASPIEILRIIFRPRICLAQYLLNIAEFWKAASNKSTSSQVGFNTSR